VIDLTLAVHELASELKVGATFFSNTSANAIAFFLSEALELPRGLHRLVVEFPSLPLLPGEYLLKLALVAGVAPYPVWTLGWQDAPRPFRVPGDPTAITNLARLVSAKVHLDARVSVVAEPAPTHELSPASR
jgi:hypothetical protein